MENTAGLPPAGDLAQVSPLRLYYLAASLDRTGLLTLRLPDRAIDVHFRKGSPEHIGSSHPDDSVGAFLLQERLADIQQLAQAEAAKERFGGELVGALFGLQILNPATAFAHLSRRAGLLLLRAISATSGAFTFEDKELPAQKALPLGNRWAVLLDAVRRIPLAELKRRLAPVLQLPVMKTGGRVQTSDLRLTPQETRALAFIDGVRSLAQLCADFPNEAETYSRVVFVLHELELVSFAAPAPHAARAQPEPSPPPVEPVRPSTASTAPPSSSQPRARPPSGPPPGPPPRLSPAGPGPAAPASPSPPVASAPPPAPEPPRTAASYEAELVELRKTAGSIKEKNFFQLLGVSEKVDGGAVKVAYFKLAKQYHPDTVAPNAPAEVGKLKSDIFGVIGDAYRTLSDDKSRAQYLENLQTGGSEKVDIAQILAAEDLFQKGTLLVKARKFPEAVKVLNEAIAGNPEEPEFYAWRGFAKFFSLPDKIQARTEALNDIHTCLKRNDRVAPAHFFLGQMAKLSGNNAEAIRYFKQTLELQPDYVDAQRELRLLTAKK